MKFSIRALLFGAALVVSLNAETVQSRPASDQVSTPRPKPKRLKWLRKLASAEVNLAMKVSGAGIERTSALPQ